MTLPRASTNISRRYPSHLRISEHKARASGTAPGGAAPTRGSWIDVCRGGVVRRAARGMIAFRTATARVAEKLRRRVHFSRKGETRPTTMTGKGGGDARAWTVGRGTGAHRGTRRV